MTEEFLTICSQVRRSVHSALSNWIMVVLVFHGRVKHDDAPVSAEVPLSQERHEEAPVTLENFPLPQKMHVVELDADPTAHCVRAPGSGAALSLQSSTWQR
jgi:hypothetical protein